MSLPKHLFFNTNIANFTEQFKAQPPKKLFLELAMQIEGMENWAETYIKLQQKAPKHSAMPLEEAMSHCKTPYLNEMKQQLKEREHIKGLIMDLDHKSLEECGFMGQHTVKHVQQRILDLQVRYANINLVIQSDFKEYVIKHKSTDGMIKEYISLKSPWYDEKGKKHIAANINYGLQAAKNAPGRFRDRTENLENMLARLYKRMGYEVQKHSRQKIMMPDLMVKKGNEVWLIEIKSEHVDHYRTMVMNFHLWSLYYETYKPFDQPEWY